MESLAEPRKNDVHAQGHYDLTSQVREDDDDDDAISCRTDLTTVKASNARRVTVRKPNMKLLYAAATSRRGKPSALSALVASCILEASTAPCS
jgi:hypothetical protein